MAVKEVPHDGDVMLDRFLALRRWLRAIGVCWNCCDTLAFLRVEQERGESAGVTANLEECCRRDRGAHCRQLANTHRQGMPPK